MTANTRKVLIVVLLSVSVLCGVGFACMLGAILHGGHQAIVSGPETATLPSSTGWVATVLLFIGTWLGGSWAKWLAMAAPIAQGVVDRATNRATDTAQADSANRIMNSVANLKDMQEQLQQKLDATPSPAPTNSHEALLSALLNTLEITSGQHIHSEGKHSLGGGVISWSIDFAPTVAASPAGAT